MPAPQHVADLATHPSASEFAVLSTSGLLERWDFNTHSRLASRQLGEGYNGTVVTYSKDGSLMFVAFAAGHMQVRRWRVIAPRGVLSCRCFVAGPTGPTCSRSPADPTYPQPCRYQ